MHMLTQVQWADKGIRVNAVAPGYVRNKFAAPADSAG